MCCGTVLNHCCTFWFTSVSTKKKREEVVWHDSVVVSWLKNITSMSCTGTSLGCPDEPIFNSLLWTNQKLPPPIPLMNTHTHTLMHTHKGTHIHTLLHQHRHTWTHIQPSSIYNSWHDPVPPLREELREFKLWPNYAPLRFAPSALCSQKVERIATAHTHRQQHARLLCFENRRPVSEQTPLFTLTHSLTHSHTHTKLPHIALYINYTHT